jgi:Carboxypeptidase regulatory-like domain
MEGKQMFETQRSLTGVLSSVAFLLALVLFIPTTSDAQVLYGTVVGNVRDVSGAAVPGATVMVVNARTNTARETITNETGAYTVSNVLPGSYIVKVSLTGFKEFSQTDVEVTPLINRLAVQIAAERFGPAKMLLLRRSKSLNRVLIRTE